MHMPAFDKDREFPNYFKIILDHEQDKDKRAALAKKIEKLIEENIHSVVKRLKLYYAENGKLKHSDYFDKLVEKMNAALDDHLKEINKTLQPGESKYDYELKVYLSGGVVRTLLAYVYKQLHISMQNIVKNEFEEKAEKEGKPFDPSLDTQADFLKNFIKTPEFWLQKLKHEQQKMKGFYVLGVGSDLDVLYKLEPRHGTHEITDAKLNTELREEIKNIAEDFLNSANGLLNLDFLSEDFRSSLLPPADVNDYQKQIIESMSQGGSALDWLAFELGSKGKIVEPSKELMEQAKLPKLQSSILENFIQGHYEYVESEIRYTDKQAMRGVRMLLESGFTSILDPKILTKQLKEILDTGKRDGLRQLILSPGALKQLLKLRRNANFEGAHNRAFREGPDSPLTLLREIINQLPEAEKKKVTLPRYLQATGRLDKKPAMGILAKGMIPLHDLKDGPKGFISQFTDKGVLYHGTAADAVTSIIKGGFFISDATQGTAVYGSGVYSTPNREVAANEYGSNVFPLHIKDNDNIKVVDMRIIKADPKLFQQLLEETEKKKYRDINELLSMEYGIDIIVYQVENKLLNDKSKDEFYVLLQNTGVIEPVQIRDMIAPYRDDFKDNVANSTFMGGIFVENKFFPLLKGDIPSSSKLDKENSIQVFDKFRAYSNLYLLSDSSDEDEYAPGNIINKLIKSVESLKDKIPSVNMEMTKQLIYENCFLASPKYVWNNLDKIFVEAKNNTRIEDAILKFIGNFALSFKDNNENNTNLGILLKALENSKNNTLVGSALEKLKSVFPKKLKDLMSDTTLNYKEVFSLLQTITSAEALDQYALAISKHNPDLDSKEKKEFFLKSDSLNQDNEFIDAVDNLMLHATKVDSVELFLVMFNTRGWHNLPRETYGNTFLLEAASNASLNIFNRLLTDLDLRYYYNAEELKACLDKVVDEVLQIKLNPDYPLADKKLKIFEEMLLSLLKRYKVAAMVEGKVDYEVNNKDFVGTMLEFACANKMSNLALELLRKGAASSAQRNTHSALFYASENGLKDVVKKMVDYDKFRADLNKEFTKNKIDMFGGEYTITLLIAALVAKDPELASILIDAGATNFSFLYSGPLPIQSFNMDRRNALEIAMELGYIDLAKKMLSQASKRNIELNQYVGTLDKACLTGDIDLIDAVLSSTFELKDNLSDCMESIYRHLQYPEYDNLRFKVMAHLLNKSREYPEQVRNQAIEYMDTDILMKLYFPKTDDAKVALLKKILQAGTTHFGSGNKHKFNIRFLTLLESEFITLGAIKNAIVGDILELKEKEYIMSVLEYLNSKSEDYPALTSALRNDTFFDQYIKLATKQHSLEKSETLAVEQKIIEKESAPIVVMHYANTTKVPNTPLIEAEHAEKEAKAAEENFKSIQQQAQAAKQDAKAKEKIAQEKANASAEQLDKLRAARKISPLPESPMPPQPIPTSVQGKRPPPPPPLSIADIERHASDARKKAQQAIAEADKARIKATRLDKEVKAAADRAQKASELARLARSKVTQAKKPPPPPPRPK